jgi:Holliday junction resolvase RusA-like endonuclease
VLTTPGPLTPGDNGMPADESVAWMLAREQRPVEVVARFTIDGEPVSKSRARFTKRGSKTHAYTPEKTHQAEQVVAWKFRQAAPGHVAEKETAYGVMAVFFNGTRQRRDVDNMLKLILDGLNKVAWADDVQVEEVSGRRGHDLPENARTEVLIYRVGKVGRRTSQCEQCGKEYPTYVSQPNRRFCSNECHLAWRAEQRRANCEQCGTVFERSHGAKYCSKECKYKAGRVTISCDTCGKAFSRQKCHVTAQNYCSPTCRDKSLIARRKGKPQGTCEVCGGGVSRKEYRRCNACKLAGRPVTGKPHAVTELPLEENR